MAFKLNCNGVPHGPNEPCTCNGCWACEGHVQDCTCDIDWDCLHGDHRSICWEEV